VFLQQDANGQVHIKMAPLCGNIPLIKSTGCIDCQQLAFIIYMAVTYFSLYKINSEINSEINHMKFIALDEFE